MNTYILHWLDGSTKKVYGYSIANALVRAGYGEEALAALDYYTEIRNARPC